MIFLIKGKWLFLKKKKFFIRPKYFLFSKIKKNKLCILLNHFENSQNILSSWYKFYFYSGIGKCWFEENIYKNLIIFFFSSLLSFQKSSFLHFFFLITSESFKLKETKVFSKFLYFFKLFLKQIPKEHEHLVEREKIFSYSKNNEFFFFAFRLYWKGLTKIKSNRNFIFFFFLYFFQKNFIEIFQNNHFLEKNILRPILFVKKTIKKIKFSFYYEEIYQFFYFPKIFKDLKIHKIKFCKKKEKTQQILSFLWNFQTNFKNFFPPKNKIEKIEQLFYLYNIGKKHFILKFDFIQKKFIKLLFYLNYTNKNKYFFFKSDYYFFNYDNNFCYCFIFKFSFFMKKFKYFNFNQNPNNLIIFSLKNKILSINYINIIFNMKKIFFFQNLECLFLISEYFGLAVHQIIFEKNNLFILKKNYKRKKRYKYKILVYFLNKNFQINIFKKECLLKKQINKCLFQPKLEF